VVHAKVMTEISFWCMAEKRTNEPGNIKVKLILIRCLESFAVAQAMKHQSKSSFKIKL
jgi:hypothetical protein